MPRYAADTSVSLERSKVEIERTLIRYGATKFFSSWQDDPPMAIIGFGLDDRMVRIVMPIPARDAVEFTLTETGRDRKPEAAYKAWEQSQRQRWRALHLIITAKLEAVDCGISSIEREFLADIVMHDGTTIGEWAGPQISAMYDAGKMPPLLMAPKKGKRR